MKKTPLDDILRVALETVEELSPPPPDAAWFSSLESATAAAMQPSAQASAEREKAGLYASLAELVHDWKKAVAILWEPLKRLQCSGVVHAFTNRDAVQALHLIPAVVLGEDFCPHRDLTVCVMQKSLTEMKLRLALSWDASDWSPSGKYVSACMVSHPDPMPISVSVRKVEIGMQEQSFEFEVPPRFLKDMERFISTSGNQDVLPQDAPPFRFLLRVE